MTCSLRSAAITPLHRYCEAVRPSPVHRYFRPRGFSACALYGLPSSGFQNDFFSCFLHRFLCSTWKSPFLRPDPAVLQSRRAQEAVKVGRRTNLSTYSGPCQASLDSSQHGGTLDTVGMTIRGEPAFGRADQSRHNLVFGESNDPNHDAAMRIGSEAPRRRTPFFSSAQKP